MARKKTDRLRLGDLIEQVFDQYDIPKREDIDRLMDRMEKLENLLKQTNLAASMLDKGHKGVSRRGRKSGVSASDMVTNLMKEIEGPVDFSIIKERTGFDDKKLRNIIFRLFKNKKIVRVSRGTYGLPE